MQSASEMARAPLLESFDFADPTPDQAIVAQPGVEWYEGHSAGLAEGLAKAEKLQTALSTEIAQCFLDMSFGYSEARAQLLQGLKPLFSALIKRVLPGLAETALAAHVITLLQDAADQDSASPLELAVNPARFEGFTTLLPFAVGMPVVLISDPQVEMNQAVLRAMRSATLLDVGAILSGVQSALGAIFETIDEKAHHG